MRKLLAAVAVACLGAVIFGGIASADTASTTAVHPGAHTSFDRTYNWQVTKTDSVASSVTIAQNQVYTLTYTISVGNAVPAYTDSNWRVEDGIPIHGDVPFTIANLADVTATATQDGGTVTTTGSVTKCSTDSNYLNLVTFPYTGIDLLCAYGIALPDGSTGTVTANVKGADNSTATGSVPFDFIPSPAGNLEPGQPNVINGSVNVYDPQSGLPNGLLGTVTPVHPQTFQYSVIVPSATCGSFDLPNVVTLKDTATGSSVATATDTVHVTVNCPPPPSAGCTLTQGYWKTHSIYGPAAKPDATWNLVGGPNATFFLSGQTWLQVFNTSPAGGNPYYILAHQYEAAVLNQLKGAASTAAVDAAMARAKTFFNTYTPAQAGALSKSSSIRAAAVNDGATLDDYNSGLIGPGHCDE
jgi:hypothetical protein